MNTQPKTRSISPDKSLDDLFPARFLKAEHLLAWHVTQIAVTISRLQEEEVTPHISQPAEWKPVIYFLSAKTGREHPQGYLLSAKVDRDSLKSATGASTTGELIGKRITIALAEHKGQAVLRISPWPPVAAT